MTSATIGVVEKSCQEFLSDPRLLFFRIYGHFRLILVGWFARPLPCLGLQQQLSGCFPTFEIAVRLFRLSQGIDVMDAQL